MAEETMVTYVVIVAREFEQVQVMKAGDPLLEEKQVLTIAEEEGLFPATTDELFVVKAEDLSRFQRQWRRV